MTFDLVSIKIVAFYYIFIWPVIFAFH